MIMARALNADCKTHENGETLKDAVKMVSADLGVKKCTVSARTRSTELSNRTNH